MCSKRVRHRFGEMHRMATSRVRAGQRQAKGPRVHLFPEVTREVRSRTSLLIKPINCWPLSIVTDKGSKVGSQDWCVTGSSLSTARTQHQ